MTLPKATRSHEAPLSRREFVKRAVGATVLPWVVPVGRLPSKLAPITFGLCADVHQDIMHDAPRRMATFVRAMESRDVDFILQLGDFCIPKPENQSFLDTFHAFAGPHYHVLGNHDTDDDELTKKGFAKDETRAFWGMQANYYSFLQGGFRFIVLDGNEINPESDPGDYPRHIGPEQRAWLIKEVESSSEPVVLFSHQSPVRHWGLDNGAQMRAIVEDINRNAGWTRILTWINGHSHIDHMNVIERVPYVHVNSMSYFWLGEDYQNFAYAESVHDEKPMMAFTAPYRDPVWATVTIDPASAEIRFEGRKGGWAGRSPSDLGYGSEQGGLTGVSPSIGSRRFDLELER